MAFDGNGNWVSAFSAVADRDADIAILASRFDGIFIADLTQSFENCLTKDAQVKPQQNFDVNNYKIINLNNPVNANDAVNYGTLTSGTYSVSGSVSLGSGVTSETPAISEDSGRIATTEWFNDKIVVVSVLPAEPDPDVYYFVTG